MSNKPLTIFSFGIVPQRKALAELSRTADREAGRPKPVDAKATGINNFINYKKQLKMKTTKMSLANIQGKLSRAEMKNIMAGSGDGCGTGDTYCGSGSGVTCCPGYSCEGAGGGQNPNVPGGDKLCNR